MENKKSPKSVFVQGAIQPAFIAESLQKHQHKHDIGAHSMFLGQVRADEKEGQKVSAIVYEAYEDMANETFHQIREDAFARFNMTCMHIHHSLGQVNAGEICLFVFTSSAHRQEAMQACEYVVERIKKDAQVWGREIMDSGDAVWKVNRG